MRQYHAVPKGGSATWNSPLVARQAPDVTPVAARSNFHDASIWPAVRKRRSKNIPKEARGLVGFALSALGDQVTAGPFSQRVTSHQRPEPRPVAPVAEVRQLVNQHVVDNPAREFTHP